MRKAMVQESHTNAAPNKAQVKTTIKASYFKNSLYRTQSCYYKKIKVYYTSESLLI